MGIALISTNYSISKSFVNGRGVLRQMVLGSSERGEAWGRPTPSPSLAAEADRSRGILREAGAIQGPAAQGPRRPPLQGPRSVPLFHADALNVLAQIERDAGNAGAAIETDAFDQTRGAIA